MNKLRAGDKVVVAYNTHSRCTSSWVRVFTVSKVGRKYFYLEGCGDKQFRLDRMTECTAYCTHYRVYRCAKEWYNDVAVPSLFAHMMKHLTSAPVMYHTRKSDYTLGQQIEVCKILGIDYNEVLSQYNEDYKRLVSELHPDTLTSVRETNG